MLEPFELGYLAGMIDGEGYIICKIDHRGNPHGAIVIVNTDLRCLEYLRKIVGYGWITKMSRGRNSNMKQTKPCYQLFFCNRKVIENLGKSLRDKLIIKKDSLEKLLTLYESKPPKKPVRPWTPEEDEIIVKNFGKLNYNEIGELINRDGEQVRGRIKKARKFWLRGRGERSKQLDLLGKRLLQLKSMKGFWAEDNGT